MIGYLVWCEICGKSYDERDPAVTFHPGGVWECYDEALCFERRAMNELDQEVKAGD